MAAVGLCVVLLAGSQHGFNYVSPGCSWYEAHMLGGCSRSPPRQECTRWPMPTVDRARLGIIVPYRGSDLRTVMPAFCERMNTEHSGCSHGGARVLIVNQSDSLPFNRGALTNAGFVLLQRGPQKLDFIAVHDADRFPRTQNKSCASAIADYYTFPGARPRVLHPSSYTGGVLLVASGTYEAINGFSNEFWGWGHEDNELFGRLRWCGLVPEHGDRLDDCMLHQHCSQCQHLTRQIRVDDATALLRQTSNIALAQAHLRDPAGHMIKDGLSTLNFTLLGRRRFPGCGACRMQVVNVQLDQASATAHTAPRPCVADGTDRDDGCDAPIGPEAVPRGVMVLARRVLGDRARMIRLASASRARVLYNYRYELDLVVATADATDALHRVAVCAHLWQLPHMRGTYGVPKYALLWHAAVLNGSGTVEAAGGRRLEAGGMSPHIRILKRFDYKGPFACDIVR
eukprot:scaffold9792_cov121-Isochrysis_galbana.AAC.5